MTTIYFAQYDGFEVEGFYNEAGELLHTWCCNDATWRSEYLNPLMTKLGITVDMSGKHDDDLKAYWIEQEGYDPDE